MSNFYTISGVVLGYGPGQFTTEHVRATDIAWHLGHLNRFGGASTRPYSVLRHSLLVAQLAPATLRCASVLHDAAEAYLGDLVGPAKSTLPSFEALELRMRHTIHEALGVPWPNDADMAAISEADHRAFCAEAQHMGPPGLWQALGTPDDETARAMLEEILNRSDSRCRDDFMNVLNSGETNR